MLNPYETLPSKAFWRRAVADHDLFTISEVWDPKHRLARRHKIATFGSCFAQNIGRALKAHGYTWFDAEPAPDIFTDEVKQKYNYEVFSARTGNIYTAAALKQWVYWALELATPPDEIWEAGGRFFDPFRPAIEPNGFTTRDELLASRAVVLGALKKIITEADRFVFTLGRVVS